MILCDYMALNTDKNHKNLLSVWTNTRLLTRIIHNYTYYSFDSINLKISLK